MSTHPTDERATARGAAGTLAYRRLGSGPPLLLINGYAATADDWDPTFVAGLAGTFTVICPDNRGVGGSDLGASRPGVAEMAADALAVLDACGLDATAVAGWSLGGFVAQELARSAPERVASLTLLATDPGGPGAALASPDVWEALTDRSGTPREQATRLISLLFPGDVADAVDRDFGEIVAAARERLDPAALDAQEDAMRAWHARSGGAGSPAVPTLAAAGALDRVIPASNAAALAGADGWLASFPGGGHGFMAQEPRRLAALIAAFAAG